MSKKRGGRYIRWEGNIPYPEYAEPIPTDCMTQLLSAALSSPYEPANDTPDEQRFAGMSNGEVGAIRRAEAYARGDIESAKFIHDRLLGKPKQQVENLNVNVTAKALLSRIADEEDTTVTVTEVRRIEARSWEEVMGL